MQRTYALAFALAAVAVAPAVAAGATLEWFVPGPSSPVNFQASKLAVALGPGDRVVADLRYDADSFTDLDLTLFSPFYDALPLTGTLLGGDPDAFARVAQHYAAQRAGRTTCTDATAASQQHLGADGGAEAFDVTVPAGSETGLYALNVQAFSSLDDVPFFLTITVLDADGADVTLDRTTGEFTNGGVLNGWAYCDAGGRALVGG